MAKTDLYAQMYHELMAEFGPIVTRGQLHAYKDRTGRGAYQVFGGKKYRVPGSHPAAYDLRKFAAEVNVGDAPTVSSTDTPAQVAPAQGVSSMPVAADLVSVEESSSMSFALPKSSSAADLRSTITALASEASQLARVPEKSSAFVPFGDFDAVKRVIASKVFLPVFITGHSGNGKTFQIEQACAQEKREYIRVNITAETDEDDLIGGFRLKDGETVFELGPIVVAMLRGAVLLLDEVDLAGPKVMCLQPVLEGNRSEEHTSEL